MLDQLIEKSMEYDTHKSDYGPAETAKFSFHDELAHLMYTEELFQGAVGLKMDDWSLGQVCQRLGVTAYGRARSLPKDYLMACPNYMRAEQLNHWLQKTDKRWFVRAYDDICRAVLSDRYTPIGVTDTLQYIKEAVDSKMGGESLEITSHHVGEDVLHIKLIFRTVNTNGSDGKYGIGGYITTGEIGNRRLGVYPLIQRHSCSNSIMIPSDEWSWQSRHVGSTHVMKQLFVAAIFNVLEGSVNALERLLDEQQHSLDNFPDFIDKLVKRKGWTVQTRDAILVGSEGHENLFGVIQGISAAAKAETDSTAQANMQLVAGSYLK